MVREGILVSLFDFKRIAEKWKWRCSNRAELCGRSNDNLEDSRMASPTRSDIEVLEKMYVNDGATS